MSLTSNHIATLERPSATAMSQSLTWLQRLYRRAVMASLTPMQAGCLRFEFPDGEVRVFGQLNATPAANIKVRREEFFRRCVLFGDVGFGEAYVDGDWDTESITDVISWFIANIAHAPTMSGSKAGKDTALNLFRRYNVWLHERRANSVEMSKQNIHEHYDLGNSFYRLFLDPTMTYSSAHFTAASQTLEEAQVAKYDRLCRQLKLKPTDHLLEIGSGWGGMACHAVKHYGCRVTTVTISEEQYKFAQERFKQEGVADRVEVLLQDYRLIAGKFDKIVSIEMLEAVGDKFLETYFARCQQLLKPDGLLALQMITCADSRYDSLRTNVDWIQKHIFPGSLLLSVGRVNQAIQNTGGMVLYDLKDIGLSYARTLHLWWEAFNARLEEVKAQGFDERFIRKWNYYLCYCEAAFAMRNISVVQVVYSWPNNPTLRG
jgi:cyclopropane-fatty-acyl-phospholipid synthase